MVQVTLTPGRMIFFLFVLYMYAPGVYIKPSALHYYNTWVVKPSSTKAYDKV